MIFDEMQDLNFLYKSWKLIFASGALSLLLSTIIILFALKKLVPLFERIHKNRLRDQHDEPIPKIGGLGLMGSMFLTIVVLWNIPFDTEIPFFQTVNQSRFFGLIVGGFMAWSLGFVDDLFKISARWKLLGQFVLALFAIQSAARHNFYGRLWESIFGIHDGFTVHLGNRICGWETIDASIINFSNSFTGRIFCLYPKIIKGDPLLFGR